MNNLTAVFIVMRRNGTHEDQKSIPIHSCSDVRDAEYLARRKNEEAAELAGKIAARDLLMEHFRSTHPVHAEDEVANREDNAENDRLTAILGIQADCEALGFSNEHTIDCPFWSVVEVPHSMP